MPSSQVSKPQQGGLQSSDRHFNIVVYGIKESPAGTSRLNRLTSDSRQVSAMIDKIDTDIPESSILDCTRFGSYSNEPSRPILVKLSRAYEVSSILSQRIKLNPLPGIRNFQFCAPKNFY